MAGLARVAAKSLAAGIFAGCCFVADRAITDLLLLSRLVTLKEKPTAAPAMASRLAADLGH